MNSRIVVLIKCNDFTQAHSLHFLKLRSGTIVKTAPKLTNKTNKLKETLTFQATSAGVSSSGHCDRGVWAFVTTRSTNPWLVCVQWTWKTSGLRPKRGRIIASFAWDLKISWLVISYLFVFNFIRRLKFVKIWFLTAGHFRSDHLARFANEFWFSILNGIVFLEVSSLQCRVTFFQNGAEFVKLWKLRFDEISNVLKYSRMLFYSLFMLQNGNKLTIIQQFADEVSLLRQAISFYWLLVIYGAINL